jgi:transcriptional regulator with XRE-family HTH domain
MSRKISRAKNDLIDWKAVGRRIRELRGFDITQHEFARRIGVSQSYLSTVEHGRVEVGAEVLLAISRGCGKSLEWLLTGEDWKATCKDT